MKKSYLIFFIFFVSLLTFDVSLVFTQPVTQEWVRRYNGWQSGISLKVDSSGFVYVLMDISTDSTSRDFGLAKYSQIGNLIWSNTYNSPGNLTDQPIAFDVTSTGDVYITGNSGINFSSHISTVKFSSNGLFQWVKTFNGGCEDLEIDKDGNVVVAGRDTANGLIIKYSPIGDTIYTRKFVQLFDQSGFSKITIDNSCNIYAAGFYGYYNGNPDFLIAKYTKDGILQWYVTYDSPQHHEDLADFISIDSSGNSYVVGTSYVPPNMFNNNLVKINSAGNIEWVRIFAGLLAGQGNCQYPAGLKISNDASSIYYTTFCPNGTGGGGYDIVTLKYNSLGDTQWVRRYSGISGTLSQPAGLEIDKYGDIYITGTSNYSVSESDYVTIKYSSAGYQQWVETYNGPLTNSDDHGKCIVVSKNLNVYVSGSSSSQNVPYLIFDAATIKYSQPDEIQIISSEVPAYSMLFQNYPNPFNGTTNIEFGISGNTLVTIDLFNIVGQKISTLVNRTLKSGLYDVSFNFNDLPSGIYFYTLVTKNHRDTKKMILIK